MNKIVEISTLTDKI